MVAREKGGRSRGNKEGRRGKNEEIKEKGRNGEREKEIKEGGEGKGKGLRIKGERGKKKEGGKRERRE